MTRTWFVTAIALLLMPAALAHEPTPPDDLEKVKGKFSEVWVNPNADFTQYDKILPGEAEFQFRDVGPAKKYRSSTLSSNQREFGVSESEQEKFKQVVSDAFIKEMARSKKFTVVSDAQPGTLLIEGAVMDIVSYVPPDMIGRNEVYLADVGAATLVLEIHDAMTGETLAYVEERRKMSNPGGGRIDQFTMPTNSVTVWADVGRWARSAASRLRSSLEDAQKGK
jgi:hypothetical protein